MQNDSVEDYRLDITNGMPEVATASIAEDRYRMLFNLTDDGFCIIKVMFNNAGAPVDYKFLEANPAFKKQAGFINATGKRMRELFSGYKKEWLEIFGKIALTGEPARFIDGNENNTSLYNVHVSPVDEPEKHHVAVLFKDIAGNRQKDKIVFQDLNDTILAQQAADSAEKHEAIEALRQSEEKYRTLFDSIDEGYCIIQMLYDDTGQAADWRFLEVNRAFEINNGLHNAQGKTIKETVPGIEQKWIDIYNRVAQTGEAIRFKEDSAALGRHFSLYAFRIGDPEERKVAVIFTDITSQIFAEAALKENEKHLHRLVEERTRELQQLNANLQQFAHMASHDLSEPVRKVHMLANRIAEEDGEKLSENGKFYLTRINSAADRMSNMIEGVLEYSVYTNLKEVAIVTDLGKIFRKIEEDLELVIQQKDVKFYYDTFLPIKGVETLLYQLFYNLIKNAIKFSKADCAPVITIAHEQVREDDKSFSKITVADNGIGFPAEDSEKIFESFTRLHSKDKYEGTGLGLALCRNIARRHGGTITAAGQKGEGAVFTVLLPVLND